MSSTRTQSKLCTATSISLFVQCQVSFWLLLLSVTMFVLIELVMISILCFVYMGDYGTSILISKAASMDFFFNFYLAVPWLTLGHYQGDSLTQLMLINAYLQYQPEGHWSLEKRLGP